MSTKETEMIEFYINGKRYQLTAQQVEEAIRGYDPDVIQSPCDLG